MQKWEYLLFEISLANNRVIIVNCEDPGKTGRLGLHEATYPNLVDYLKYIGEQGWEIVGTGKQFFYPGNWKPVSYGEASRGVN